MGPRSGPSGGFGRDGCEAPVRAAWADMAPGAAWPVSNRTRWATPLRSGGEFLDFRRAPGDPQFHPGDEDPAGWPVQLGAERSRRKTNDLGQRTSDRRVRYLRLAILRAGYG